MADAGAGLVIVAPARTAPQLCETATAAGCPVALSGTPHEVAAWCEAGGNATGWLIDAAYGEDDELLARLAADTGTPLLVCDEALPTATAERELWLRRLRHKLEEMAGLIATPADSAAAAPAAVWVLAASTGGPAAVSEFLAGLEPGLPIALVYAQHIEANFDRFLAAGLERHRHYGVDLCGAGQQLLPGRILVIPADRQVRFLPFHRVARSSEPWEGPFQPAIDQVVAQLARLYGSRCGVIIFSGLCDDGALGCRILHGKGGMIWVQSPASCVSAAMPEAALATGMVSLAGRPAELAAALNQRYGMPPLSSACR